MDLPDEIDRIIQDTIHAAMNAAYTQTRSPDPAVATDLILTAMRGALYRPVDNTETVHPVAKETIVTSDVHAVKPDVDVLSTIRTHIATAQVAVRTHIATAQVAVNHAERTEDNSSVEWFAAQRDALVDLYCVITGAYVGDVTDWYTDDNWVADNATY